MSIPSHAHVILPSVLCKSKTLGAYNSVTWQSGSINCTHPDPEVQLPLMGWYKRKRDKIGMGYELLQELLSVQCLQVDDVIPILLPC